MMPFLLLLSGGCHVNRNALEFSADTCTSSGGAEGTEFGSNYKRIRQRASIVQLHVPVCSVLVSSPNVVGPVAIVSAATVQLYVV